MSFLSDYQLVEKLHGYHKTIFSGYGGNAAARQLSISLGNGDCRWQPPEYDIPTDIDFYKTVIVGYPSGDKRLTFIQLEALAGLAARDEWDFAKIGYTNAPFIKANYPHHEGIWGWDDIGDQVVLVVRNIRRTMVEYHDILWDIGYAKTFEDAFARISNLYAERPPLSDFLAWRDRKVLLEIDWYGWFIDFYMENGLMRDMFSKKTTTASHWEMLMQPTRYKKEDITYDKIVGNETVENSYDPNCSRITNGCHPVQIISAERLVSIDPLVGPREGRKIAELIMLDGMVKKGFEDYMIEEDAWECIWTELVINKRGVKTFLDRDGLEERDYYFSEFMLVNMIAELQRLITKYSSEEWDWSPNSGYLVELLSEHKSLIEEELDEVRAGGRRLKETDFLGPEMRESLKLSKQKTNKRQHVHPKTQRQLDTGTEFDFSALDEEFYRRKSKLMDERMKGLFGL